MDEYIDMMLNYIVLDKIEIKRVLFLGMKFGFILFLVLFLFNMYVRIVFEFKLDR